MQKVNYITKKDFLREIHNSKNSFCSYLDKEHLTYHVIVQDKAQITADLIAEVVAAKAKPKGKTPPVILEPEQVVVRVMTHEHIPLDPDRKRKARNTDQSYARTNFPPFKHFVMRDGALVEVCRSHWEGGFENGHFSLEKGKINNRLAVMFMLLVERISRRGNWRGYCVSSDTEALTQRGWLKFDEIDTSDIVLGHNMETGQLEWTDIKGLYVGEYKGNMFKLDDDWSIDALVTPGHKWVTSKGVKTTEMLRRTDTIIVCGSAEKGADKAVYSDAAVIEMAHKPLSMPFILSLTADQRHLLIEAMGYIAFENGYLVDALLFMSANNALIAPVNYVDMHGDEREGAPNEPTHPYDGIVWCPQTGLSTWVARRNGTIYVTHNSYVEEMRGHALAQLSQVGLMFDESKSDNPFAFYTTAVNHSFTRVLNLERKSQNIRDDLLIMVGSAPSITRQVDNELEYRFPKDAQEKKAPAKKRQAKAAAVTFKED